VPLWKEREVKCPNPECQEPLSLPVYLTDELLEQLAKLEHEQWMKWSQEVATSLDLSRYQNMERLQRWKKFWVPYSDLQEEAKEFDREWVRKVLGLLIEANFISCKECGTVIYKASLKERGEATPK